MNDPSIIFLAAVVALGIYFIYSSVSSSHAQAEHEARLVAEGKAAYFVKVAASGKGSVYHSMNCNKCIAWQLLTKEEARTKGYAPCATCGGRGQFRMLETSTNAVSVTTENSPNVSSNLLPLSPNVTYSESYKRAAEAIAEGRSIRRSSWAPGNTLLTKNGSVILHKVGLNSAGIPWYGPSRSDQEADDWEVVSAYSAPAFDS
jgi:hypothetical protein